MNLTILIILILLILTIVILYKISKKIITTLISVSILIAILLIILLYFTYIDITTLQNKFSTTDNLILLKDLPGTGTILTGLTMNLEKNTTTYLSKQELDLINLKENSYYKTIILKIPFLEGNLKQQYQLTNEITLTKEQIISILKSNEPINEFGTYTNNKIRFQETDNYKFKAQILTLIFENMPFNLILKEYKDNNLEVYPETITFKIIKIIPKPILNNIQ